MNHSQILVLQLEDIFVSQIISTSNSVDQDYTETEKLNQVLLGKFFPQVSHFYTRNQFESLMVSFKSDGTMQLEGNLLFC